MDANNAMQIILPMVDAKRERSGFQVARVLAAILNASLRVAAAAPGLPARAHLAQQLSIPVEQLDDVAIEDGADDLAAATIRIANAMARALVILAIRLDDQPPPHDMHSLDAVGLQVLEKLTCPVLIVPPEQDMSGWYLHKELLPQDGTPNCATALANIICQSMNRGIESLVLRVAGANVGQPAEPGSLATPRYVDHPQYEWEAWGREFLDRIIGAGAAVKGTDLRLLMSSGDPATEILRVAQGESVDMIVLPWHCAFESGRARMLKAVLHGASCPVMLLPEHCGDGKTDTDMR